MRRFIIIAAILASAALCVLLAQQGAFTAQGYQSARMIITVVTADGTVVARDEMGRSGNRISEEDVIKLGGKEVGKIYVYKKNPNCTVYCQRGWCWEFCY